MAITAEQANSHSQAHCFRSYAAEIQASTPALHGFVVVFDSADGRIVGATVANAKQFADGALSSENFWKQCYLNPPDVFQVSTKP
jgi:hypothetical protein